jgi:uncharacterized membrane protein
LLIFLALLLAWTEHPAKVISGVQGRYFLFPAILTAFALSADERSHKMLFKRISYGLLFVLYIFSIFQTRRAILERYSQAEKTELKEE